MSNLTTAEPDLALSAPDLATRLNNFEQMLPRAAAPDTKERNVINLDEVQQLQAAYGSEWIVRVTNGQPCATRRRSLSDEEISAGMAMTLYEGDGGALAELLAKQERIDSELIRAALS